MSAYKTSTQVLALSRTVYLIIIFVYFLHLYTPPEQIPSQVSSFYFAFIFLLSRPTKDLIISTFKNAELAYLCVTPGYAGVAGSKKVCSCGRGGRGLKSSA